MDVTSPLATVFPDLEWDNDRQGNEFAEVEVGPFTIRIDKEYDDDFGYDMGKGISNPEDGAIRNRNAGYNEYKWYLPETTAEDHYKELARDASWTIDECRAEASKYAMQDFQRWADYGNGWSYLYIKVTITYLGYEIGEAGCGGVESDSEDEHIFTIALEDMGDAINQALNALEQFKDAPSYLLVELDAKIDASFKEAYDAQRAAWTGPTFASKSFDPENRRREDKDIPPYVPVDEDEWHRIYCPICEDNQVTDEEDRYEFGRNVAREYDFMCCRSCYYELYEEAEAELIRLHDESCAENGVFYNISVNDVEAKMAQMRREEVNERG